MGGTKGSFINSNCTMFVVVSGALFVLILTQYNLIENVVCFCAPRLKTNEAYV
jgi:hypothetical protein